MAPPSATPLAKDLANRRRHLDRPPSGRRSRRPESPSTSPGTGPPKDREGRTRPRKMLRRDAARRRDSPFARVPARCAAPTVPGRAGGNVPDHQPPPRTGLSLAGDTHSVQCHADLRRRCGLSRPQDPQTGPDVARVGRKNDEDHWSDVPSYRFAVQIALTIRNGRIRKMARRQSASPERHSPPVVDRHHPHRRDGATSALASACGRASLLRAT
jgi:hypothetical protein